MPRGIFGDVPLPSGARGYLLGEESAQRNTANQLGQFASVLGLSQQMQMQPLQLELMRQQVSAGQNPAPLRIDTGGAIELRHPQTYQLMGSIPKTPTPDASLRESGATQRHVTPSGSAVLSETGAAQRHTQPSGSALLGAQVTMRGQDLQEGREQFGAPQEVTVGGRPALVIQNRRTGQVVDANTQAPVTGVGPKVGETAQKQQTGVVNVKDAIAEYRQALKGFGALDVLNPAARARMGTIYNNMMLQAKEAYNLGVLNGPDYMILQQVITNPSSLTGAITPRGDLDAQAAKLDEIMTRVGGQVSNVQTGQQPERRQADRRSQGGFRVLGVER